MYQSIYIAVCPYFHVPIHAEKDPFQANGILLLQEENNLDLAVKIISSCSKRKILCWQIILLRRGFLFKEIEGLVDR